MELQFGLKLETHLSFVNNLRVILICFFYSLFVYMCQREERRKRGRRKEKEKKEKEKI